MAAKLKFSNLTGFPTAIFRGNKISRGFYARWSAADFAKSCVSVSARKKTSFLPVFRFIARRRSPAYPRTPIRTQSRKSTRYRHLAPCLAAKRLGEYSPHAGDRRHSNPRLIAKRDVYRQRVSFIIAPCLITAPATWLRRVYPSALPKIWHAYVYARFATDHVDGLILNRQ